MSPTWTDPSELFLIFSWLSPGAVLKLALRGISSNIGIVTPRTPYTPPNYHGVNDNDLQGSFNVMGCDNDVEATENEAILVSVEVEIVDEAIIDFLDFFS